jgi:hypothetical protein
MCVCVCTYVDFRTFVEVQIVNLLTLFIGLCLVGLISSIDIVPGDRRQKLISAIGPIREGFTEEGDSLVSET